MSTPYTIEKEGSYTRLTITTTGVTALFVSEDDARQQGEDWDKRPTLIQHRPADPLPVDVPAQSVPRPARALPTGPRPLPPWEVPAEVERDLYPLPHLPTGWRWVPTASHALVRAEHTNGTRTTMHNRAESDIRQPFLREIGQLEEAI